MRILKRGTLAPKPFWPKVRTCQECGSELEIERQDTKHLYFGGELKSAYKCEACYNHNLLDEVIEDRQIYETFNEHMHKVHRAYLGQSLERREFGISDSFPFYHNPIY